MSKPHPLNLAFLDDRPLVEPVKRMVGGRYGWAIHRFPIKGGKTIRETVMRGWADSLAAFINRPSFLMRMLAVKGGPIERP